MISKNFSLIEFLKSEAAKKHNINDQYSPPQEIIDNIFHLVKNTVQPLRDQFGQPIIINSGYRHPAVNKLVGGSKKSFHLYGMAADIVASNLKDNKEIFKLCLGLPFTELIWEYGTNDYPKWVHVALSKNDSRKMIKRIDNNGVKRLTLNQAYELVKE